MYVATLLIFMKADGIVLDLRQTNKELARGIFTNAIPFFVAGFLLNFFSYAPKILIGQNYGPFELALYNASFQIVNLGWILPRSVFTTFLILQLEFS